MTPRRNPSLTVDPSLDKRVEALTACRRRCILYYLFDTDDDLASVDDLVDEVLKHDPDAYDKEKVALSLDHVHLPKLSDAGLIEYDARSATVRYQGSAKVDELLRTTRELE